MKTGLFVMPVAPPERPLAESIDQTLETLVWADQLGYAEAWLGEHLSVPWEPLPAADLIIAQALRETERIMLCSGAYVLPYYHPAALACRVMQLDHMARGRYMCGVATGFSPTDMKLTGVADAATATRMLRESLEIMMKIWTDHVGAEWTYEGEFWTVTNPAPMGAHGPHLRPFQSPHPPIAMAGQTPRSPTLEFAGSRGFIPLSIIENKEMLAEHWDVYSAAAAAGGHSEDRNIWRVARTVFVADTDEQARAWMRKSAHARYFSEAGLPGARKRPGALDSLKHDLNVPDEDVDVEYLMDHMWLVGSPETVADRLIDIYRAVGGFGTVLQTKLDRGEDPDGYRHSLDLFANTVIPKVEQAVGTKVGRLA